MADLSGLYPQPPQNNNALMSNPLQLIGTIGQLNQNALFQKQFQAKQAVGAAFQSALNPDGTVDQSKLAAGLRDPAAAYAAPEAIGSALDMRRKQIDNSSASLGLGVAHNQAAAGIIGALAQKPNPTMEDVYNAQAAMARAGVDPHVVSAWGAGTNEKNIKDRLGVAANYAMGAGAAASPQAGPIGPNGEPTTITTGSRAFGAPTIQTGQGPIQIANQNEYLGDQTTGASRLANVRPLEQALPLVAQLSHFSFGPGSNDISKVNGLLTTLGITGVDPTSEIAVRQEVNKKLLGYASGARDAGRSDNALSAALGSNPNLDLTQPANLALIKNQIGMDKMDAALPIAAGSPNGYKDFKSRYYQGNDPRAFAINTYTPEEIGALQKSLKGADRDKFNRSLQIAIKSGIVTPPSAPASGQ